jgi:uncharacterized membrane protein
VRRAGGRTGALGPEDGQLLVFLVGLVVLVLMMLALGWDTSNWFLGHRALGGLADGAAVAAAGELDTAAFYRSGGRAVAVAEGRARTTVRAFVADAAGDSGVAGVAVASVGVRRGPGGPEVSVGLTAETPVGLLRLLGVVPPRMSGGATASALLVAP